MIALNKLVLFFILLLAFASGSAQNYRVIESAPDHIKIEFNFSNAYKIIDTLIDGKKFQFIAGVTYPLRTAGEPWLPAYYINIGIPNNSNPQVKILSLDKTVYQNKFILPMPAEDPSKKPLSVSDLNENIYSKNNLFPSEPANVIDNYFYRYSHIIILNASPFQFNPVSRELIFNRKILVEVTFGSLSKISIQSAGRINDPKTYEFIKNSVVNKNEAVNWIGESKTGFIKKSFSVQSNWYDPAKSYYQIYLNKKGLYRITYQQLAAAGVVFNNVLISKLELLNDGNQIPVYISDNNNDGIFDQGDYFEFIGYPPKATPYAATNIYNVDNVYFFSTELDSSGLRYIVQDGLPKTWDYTFQTNYAMQHFEKDSLYESLGYAGDDKRDFWLWDNASAQHGTIQHSFEAHFDGLKEFNYDSAHVKIKVQLQGLTINSGCSVDHNAYIYLTNQLLGSISWAGQNTATFEKIITISKDSIKLYPTGNVLRVQVTGDVCPLTSSDEIAINWFDVEYWRDNRADTNHLEFSSPPNAAGKIRYWTWRFIRDSIKIFIPQKNKIIKNALIPHDEYNSAFFVDSVFSPVDYFCAGYDYFLSPDSIKKSAQSDLKNTSNGADYIIITHPDFKSVAERLADFRSKNFPDSSIANPRIKIVYVNQIYNEFSNGLLDPNALKNFVKYSFTNWQKPSPSYVVLLGDMSHDYRHLLSTSHPSFVPSIPYYSNTLGESVSDNMIAAVSDDIHPDLAIGRLSCETEAEGNILIDKLMNYPQDNSKPWKQNVLMLSSGLSQADEDNLGLNDASVQLEQSYLIPNGFHSTKVMRYPNRPEYLQYQGGGPEIRDKINQGAALINYYGHGGGYQWDLTFLNDDIYLLNNEGRLPLILSVTCYTAHFDDQDVFGEQFNKVAGKGSIGFFGNVGLTYWSVGTYIDNLIFDEIFNKRNYISGKVFQYAKDVMPAAGYNASQIALLTYLGDPVLKLALPDKPDFSVTSADISFGKENAVVNDTLQIKIYVKNLGTIFPNDSVTVQLFVESSDSSYSLNKKKLGSFGIEDSTVFIWIPRNAGSYSFSVKVNEENIIPEMDHSDNFAKNSIVVYNINYPNIISPVDGFTSQGSSIEFRIADIGYYLSHPMNYFIQMDTSLNFNNPVSSSSLTPSEGLISWKFSTLQKGIYFWRARIYDGKDSSSWSQPRTFSIMDAKQNGFFVRGKQLAMFDFYNMNVSDSGLALNTNFLPPKPSNKTFLEDIKINTSVLDSVGMTSITTDGSYIFFGNIWYYALKNNSEGYSKIYKIGTGLNGTIKGQFYGALPNFYAPIKNEMFYFSDGFIYVADGDPYSLLKVDKNSGDTVRVFLKNGLLRWDNAKVQNGSFYLTSDSNFVYNLTTKDSLGNNYYILRTFDPKNNWSLAKPDMQLSGTSYPAFSGFFVADGYIFPYENYESGFMRRIRLSDGVFEEEWITYNPFQGYYAWCYGATNNLVYTSVFREKGVTPKISKFKGKYLDASGVVTTNEIGPASKWKTLSYSVNNNSMDAVFKVTLLGKNFVTNQWDTLKTNVPYSFNIGSIDTRSYKFIKLDLNFWDSSFTSATPVKLKSISVDYSSLPDIALLKNEFVLSRDSALQGVPINIKLKLHNYGLSNADSVEVKLSLNRNDSPFYSNAIPVPVDSTVEINTLLQTGNLLSANKIIAEADLPSGEFYTFNNSVSKNFFVIKDSVKPSLSITFDGKEILNGDIVSSKPVVVMSLKDNSALPIDTTNFLISFDDNPFNFSTPEVKFTSTPYPNAQAEIKWTPSLADGKHTISFIAKDPSGNYSDSAAHTLEFYVLNQAEVLNVYNYPNPFSDNTNFTFQLTGAKVPDEFAIKIFTVAGRLIKNISVSPSELQIGFNKIYWDGRDQDGSLLANGVYFYKIIVKNNGSVKTVIQKLAKVK
ncbi:MAG: C25 family cysteine peptidase [Ignavibacteriaceae bacterium]